MWIGILVYIKELRCVCFMILGSSTKRLKRHPFAAVFFSVKIHELQREKFASKFIGNNQQALGIFRNLEGKCHPQSPRDLVGWVTFSMNENTQDFTACILVDVCQLLLLV